MSTDEQEALEKVMQSLPQHTIEVSTKDGYHPSALLFVDEGFGELRTGREGNLATLLFKPSVRFFSGMYTYEVTDEGPLVLQSSGNRRVSNIPAFAAAPTQRDGPLAPPLPASSQPSPP
jgi:hypothetical protein